MTALLHSLEHQLGDLLLNKLRLRRPLTAAHSLWLALHNRFVVAKLTLRSLTVGGAAQLLKDRLDGAEHRAKWKAVVAATGRFPIYSHTFVYQELMGLHEIGLDIRLFYWIREKPEAIHAAYSYLLKNSVKLQSVREDHIGDMNYWKNTHPARWQALLEKIARATGRSGAELEHEYEIMQACTFARTAEQAGVDYVHTYFFYEQSLFGMVTAWLLNIPRGITAYADHMLNDYPFKLVPLHLETADVIVATSQRIKRELVEIAGDRFADKILVKPNGVNGRRFPFQVRIRNSTDFEVISVSRIEPKKGLLTLVEAARLLLDRGRLINFHIVGTPDPGCPGSVEFAEVFYALIRNQGVSEHFVLHGYKDQEELVPLLRKVHVFVAPYVETPKGDKDGIPTALLEAMATGLPSVTTDAGSVLEVVDNGVEALVVPQCDPVRFAQALEQLMDDPVLGEEMGRRARERFDVEFDCRVTEKKLHEKITEVLGRDVETAGQVAIVNR
jgi:glycosyltransferase involved in cell wall biosynthesis